MRMYFTNVVVHEARVGVPMYGLSEVDTVLDAINEVTSSRLASDARSIAATLASDRTWSTRLPHSPRTCVFIAPRPDSLYTISFTEEQERFEPTLAAKLQRERGTASVTISCGLDANSQREFMLDTNWLLGVVAYYGFANENTPDGDALSAHLANGTANHEALCFTSEPTGLRLFVDETYLGPPTDDRLRPLRTAGFGIVRGRAHDNYCSIGLILTSIFGCAFGAAQTNIRRYAEALANLTTPAHG